MTTLLIFSGVSCKTK